MSTNEPMTLIQKKKTMTLKFLTAFLIRVVTEFLKLKKFNYLFALSILI